MRNQPFDIASLHALYADGIPPADVIAEVFRRVEVADDPGIFLHLPAVREVQAVAASLGAFDPAARPLWGIPFAVKDNIDVAGMPTTAACPAFTYRAEHDAFVVAALRQAGAIPIGKVNLDQFATGLVGVRTPYPVPRNAIDPDIVPGGSSSGSAVAVSRGIVGFALGTDTAGSGRVPAALNNIVGLKPTLGAFSSTGVVPACRTLDTVSVLAMTVGDAYRVFQCGAVQDPGDSFSRPTRAPDLGAAAPVRRIAVPDDPSRQFFGDGVQAASFARALARLAELGCETVETDFTPFFEIARMLYEGPWVAERYAAIETMLRDRPQAVHPVTRQVIEVAKGFSAVDAFKGLYQLRDLRRRVEPVLSDVDALCVPSVPNFPSLRDLEDDPITPNARLGVYTNFVNLLDLCGLAVPTAPRSDGRPGGVTFLARAGADATIAALGVAVHARAGVTLGATDWPVPEAPGATSVAAEDEIALAVVGAHMTGLPLNHELTKLGARFLRSAKTAPNYRLFRLAGGPPVRPGLIRVPDGHAIDLEVWGLPTERFGAFIQGVPSPLGIGTLTLADGDQVKGFLCEQIAVEDAEDVTQFGGWRAFLASQRIQPKESSHA